MFEWVSYFEGSGELASAAPEQRQVLSAAAAKGELTYSDVSGLIELVFECVGEQGLEPHWQEPGNTYGFPVPRYAITESPALGSEASQQVMDSCINRYSAIAEQLYLWQPTNAAMEAKYWERESRPTMVDCLRDNGVTIDDDATRNEIEMAALELATPTGPSDDPVFGTDCFPPSP